MPSRFAFKDAELTRQVYRFVAARVLLYLGAMSSYFIGVMGTLTFAMGSGVGDNAIAVGLLNLCIVFGQMGGGSLLDRVGPRAYIRLVAFGLMGSGLLYQVLGTSMVGVFVGAAVFGYAWGLADIVPRAFPPYLTGEAAALKRINALTTVANNVSIVVGPLIGGTIALTVSTQAVFLFMAACAALSLLPGWGIRALRDPVFATAPGDRDEGVAGGSPHLEGEALGTGRDVSGVSAGFSTIFSSDVLTLLFWATLLSFMGYGAFDPLESLFYRDVLNVGVEWMGWLSALAGVGGLIGAALAGIMPERFVNVRWLLVILCVTGIGSLLYVSTSFVVVACAGQFVLGVAFAAFGPIKDTLVQMHTPLGCIGRVNAAMGAGYSMAGAVPLLCAPMLARLFGVQGTLVLAGVLVAVIPLAILLMRRREVELLVEVERLGDHGEPLGR